MFERFRQADASTTRGRGGPGVGLAIVTQVGELRAGTICAWSAGVGPGATCTVAVTAPTGRRASEDTQAAPTNLPTVVRPLIGRDAVIQEVCAALESRRLVTLTGPGGVVAPGSRTGMVYGTAIAPDSRLKRTERLIERDPNSGLRFDP